MTHRIGDLVRYDRSNDGRIGVIVDIKYNNNDYQDDEYVVLWLNDGKTIIGYMSDQLIGE
ncbi:MAG: hypothetical protein RIR47_55 [Bacteroidota bacterium]|jgi:predicted alpha/beta superfamily hydrolase